MIPNVATLNTMGCNQTVGREQLLAMHNREQAARQIVFAAKQLRSLISGPIPAQTLIQLAGDEVTSLPTATAAKPKRQPGRPKDPRRADRDQFVAKNYPIYLAQERTSHATLSPKDKRAIPKGDRAENTPSIRAARRIEKEIVSHGYPRVGWREVLNISSSAKMK
jgi:hypothetical protein